MKKAGQRGIVDRAERRALLVDELTVSCRFTTFLLSSLFSSSSLAVERVSFSHDSAFAAGYALFFVFKNLFRPFFSFCPFSRAFRCFCLSIRCSVLLFSH